MMKIKQNEILPFNIINSPFPKPQQKSEVKKNLLISQRLNMPLIPLISQQEINETSKFKLFKHSYDQKFIQDRYQHNKAYTETTSLKSKEQMEYNIKYDKQIPQDFHIKERSLTQQFMQKQKKFDIQFKNQINKTERNQSVSTEPFEKEFKNFSNYEYDFQRKSPIIKQNFPYDNTYKINNKNIMITLRNQNVEGTSGKNCKKQETVSKNKKFKKLKFKKLTLKIIAIFVQATLRLSKKYKLIFLKRNLAIEHFRKQKSPHLNYFSNIGPRQIQKQNKDFAESLFQKIIQLLKGQSFIKDYTDILEQNQEIIEDFQKQRLCFLIKILLQNLELITRKSIIPEFILHSLNLCLFSGKQTQTSQFVANRTKFYSKTVYFLNSQQKTLIALEYLIFTIIIPNIIDIANEQECDNQDHHVILQFYFSAIAMLISVFFTNHFQVIPKIDQSNIKPVQLIIKLSAEKQEEDKQMKLQLLLSKELEKNEQRMLAGTIKFNFIDEIFNQKPKWKQQMTKLFSIIVNNISNLINIENFE